MSILVFIRCPLVAIFIIDICWNVSNCNFLDGRDNCQGCCTVTWRGS